jgi:UDP-N-acetyl-D-glucosamine/UDP-N-acetyl-D-galactosamine dehydrogenase
VRDCHEPALIFDCLGLRTKDVLEAAGTKWNFLRSTPGLVGGHCIGVDPYYLTTKAERVGYYPQVILAGRRINDGMGVFVAQKTVKLLSSIGRSPNGARVAVFGLTFKEDVADVRNSKYPRPSSTRRTPSCMPSRTPSSEPTVTPPSSHVSSLGA